MKSCILCATTIHIGQATSLHAEAGCDRFFATVFSLRDDDMTAFRGHEISTPKTEFRSPETILEPPRYVFEVPHPAGPRRLSALRLLSPLVGTQFRTWVPTLRAFYTETKPRERLSYYYMSRKRTLVLLVERTIAAAAAECMRLGVAFTDEGIRRVMDGTGHKGRRTYPKEDVPMKVGQKTIINEPTSTGGFF
jgi:hypothetical protein